MSLPHWEDWEHLTPSAQSAVADLIAMLADRMTGRVEIEVREGGIVDFRETRSRKPGDLGTRKRERA